MTMQPLSLHDDGTTDPITAAGDMVTFNFQSGHVLQVILGANVVAQINSRRPTTAKFDPSTGQVQFGNSSNQVTFTD